MKRLLAVLALGAGIETCYGIAFVHPVGHAEFLDTATGSGSGFVTWDGTTTFAAMFDFGMGAYGYIVADATDTVVEDSFVNASPIHFATTGNPVHATLYYLATSDDAVATGEQLSNPIYTSERWCICSPEPGACAVIAGLGLIGFAGYRRFRA